MPAIGQSDLAQDRVDAERPRVFAGGNVLGLDLHRVQPLNAGRLDDRVGVAQAPGTARNAMTISPTRVI
jgi:hypothetical protein